MIYFLILFLIATIIFTYFRQERFNKLLFTYLLQSRIDGDDKFEYAINSIFLNDAVKIKKYLKKHFNNMIDVDSDPIFKDIKKV